MSEPDASMCTRIDSHNDKRESHAKTTATSFKLLTIFQWAKGISLILMWVNFGVAICTRCTDMLKLEASVHKIMTNSSEVVNHKFITKNL
jgi:NADH:ubiquinone oxidoreductase subunit B-like Fe-S oxidoreductase